jgi:hypothetical protein
MCIHQLWVMPQGEQATDHHTLSAFFETNDTSKPTERWKQGDGSPIGIP